MDGRFALILGPGDDTLRFSRRGLGEAFRAVPARGGALSDVTLHEAGTLRVVVLAKERWLADDWYFRHGHRLERGRTHWVRFPLHYLGSEQFSLGLFPFLFPFLSGPVDPGDGFHDFSQGPRWEGTLEGLEPGKLSIKLLTSHVSIRKEVTIVAGQTTEVTLRLPGSGGD